MPQVETNNSALPLELTIDSIYVGGLTGLSPTVAVRNVSLGSPPHYLDWADNTFKTSGWTTKYQVMTEIEHGHYQEMLNVQLLALPVSTYLTAEYRVDAGNGIEGSDMDVFEVVRIQQQVNFLRKVSTNRLWEAPGNPGTLVLYDDDGITPVLTWTLLDESGGPITGTSGTPARRSAGT